MITREMLIQAMQPVNGRVPTLQEMGNRFGVSRERVRQRLREEGLKKPNTHLPRHYCDRCGNILSGKSITRGICVRCLPIGTVVTMKRNGHSDYHTGHLAIIWQIETRPTGWTRYTLWCSCGKWLRNTGHFAFPEGYLGKKHRGHKPEPLSPAQIAPGRIHPSWIQRHG